jgi:hypothetical protein
MGCVLDRVLRYIVERVGCTIERYEAEASFSGIQDTDLKYFPKCYLMFKVRSVDLEFVWKRLPKVYQEDAELLQCRPCLKHYAVEEGDWTNSVFRKKDCFLCRYNAL